MNIFDAHSLGLRMRERRKELNISQKKMAELCGTSIAYIGHIERGQRTPSLDVLLAVCDVLNVSPNYLLQDSLALSPEDLLQQDPVSAKRYQYILQHYTRPPEGESHGEDNHKHLLLNERAVDTLVQRVANLLRKNSPPTQDSKKD